MPTTIARSAAALIFADGATHGDLGTSAAWRHIATTSSKLKRTGDGREGGDIAGRHDRSIVGDEPCVKSSRGEQEGSIDRKSLLSRLAAEERLAVMADHLGWSEPLDIPWKQSTFAAPLSPRDDPTESNGPTTNAGLGGRQRSRQRRADSHGHQKRAHSAEDANLRSRNQHSQSDPSLTRGPEVLASSKRRKRTRDKETADGRAHARTFVSRPGLSRSSSFSLGQNHEDRNMEEKESLAFESSCPSLPNIKCSRLNR